MKIVFTSRSWPEYLWWQSQEPHELTKVNGLIEECMRHPFKGTGKPEPLKGKLSGFWSRRITKEHRLVYRVTGSDDAPALEIAQCRFHY